MMGAAGFSEKAASSTMTAPAKSVEVRVKLASRWEPDELADSCPCCGTNFNAWLTLSRRHHCRSGTRKGGILTRNKMRVMLMLHSYSSTAAQNTCGSPGSVAELFAATVVSTQYEFHRSRG